MNCTTDLRFSDTKNCIVGHDLKSLHKNQMSRSQPPMEVLRYYCPVFEQGNSILHIICSFKKMCQSRGQA